MISRRLAAIALCLLAFAGCHEDPTVVAVTVSASVQALALLAEGGAASSLPGTDGTGGDGGDFMVKTSGLLSLGSPSFVPSAPALPVSPSVFEFTAVSPLGSNSKTGNILIDGATTDGITNPIVLTSTNGDIVVSGLLQSADTGGVQADIQLSAPKGTVYVTGGIRTAGDDSLTNGRSGGNLTISAARVVITGTIDTHGVANTAANGGSGGTVTISSSLAPIFFTGGSIVTAGGSCVDTTSIGALKGGNGGVVSLNPVTPVNSVFVFAPITTDGGAITANGATPTGGNAGAIAIKGIGDVNVVANLSSLGGAATGNNIDARGGLGGSLSIDGAATARIYGSLALAGGTAFAVNAAGSVIGGKGGSVLLGQTTRLDSVEFGNGNYSMAGGSGMKSPGTGGGIGGTVAIESFAGDVTIGASLSVAGGSATGAGNASGGAAGKMTLLTDAQATGNLSNHALSIDSLASLLDASGGAALGTGSGGAGGTVLMQCGGDLTSGARINVSGGSSVTGIGGDTTILSPAVNVNSAVALRVTTNQLTPTGDLNVAGEILAQGGVATSGGTGGNGASITLDITGGSGSITCLATLNTTGGTDVLGNGGLSRNVFVSCPNGEVDLSGSITVTGAASPGTPTNSGNVTVDAGGLLTSSATINAAGGAATNSVAIIGGMNGGLVTLRANGSFGGVALLGGSFIVADGGSSASAGGGTGGTITLQSNSQPIDMVGTLTARGGAGGGSGNGGTGGRVIATSDAANTGVAGNITLEGGSAIDVSGGTGVVAGIAVNNATVDPGPSATTNMAVVFDADRNLTNSGGTKGRISNFGTITATGSVGGDIWYAGLNSAGAPLTALDGVGLNFSGPVPGHFFFH